jgi:ribosomal protein S18 acetylase RimI-like enzyme
MPVMEMRPFVREDFEPYRLWFVDPVLDRELGPMDNHWLEYVLNENPPKEFCFFENDKLVAVIGTELPEPETASWYITAIAVDPTRKREGIGRRAIETLIENHSTQTSAPQKWTAFVSKTNIGARRFFRELNWFESVEAEPDDMFKFSLEMNT